MHTFVHPTKTGGTAVEQYFAKHHAKHIKGVGHMHTCRTSVNPIIIIRDPVDRFVSIFNYWRNGAEDGKYVRGEDWNPPIDNISEFVAKLKSKDPAFRKQHLHKGFTLNIHFAEQSDWISCGDYSKTIVIVYDKHDMENKIRQVLHHLGLPDKGLPLPRVNVSKVDDGIPCDLSDDERAWVRRHFRSDTKLWQVILEHPERFKKVF